MKMELKDGTRERSKSRRRSRSRSRRERELSKEYFEYAACEAWSSQQ